MNFKTVFVLLITTTLLSACIKEEALNAEADINAATIPNAAQLLQSDATIRSHSVQFVLKETTENAQFAPEFILSQGASITPPSGSKHDFTEPQTYTVTSEDGQWTKTYTVSFTMLSPEPNPNDPTLYSFENVEVVDTDEPEGHFHQFFEFLPNGQKKYAWSTANEGYNILAETLLEEDEELIPEFYPTAQTPEGYKGKGVKLQTKGTGPLGSIFQSPLAAGNLFLGGFKLTIPTTESTLFGIPYTREKAPQYVRGYFKYKAGEEFETHSETPSKLDKDTWDAYAILFEKRDTKNYLDGTHAFADPRMVSLARIKPSDRIETNQWTPFELQFEFVNGKSFDPNKEYMITIVFTSSLEGDLFNGAVGSTLWIDEVEIE